MNDGVRNIPVLRKILWSDALVGGVNAIIGLVFANKLTPILGLATNLILIISVITLLYAVVAYILARQKVIVIPLLQGLVFANWIWAFISILLLFFHYNTVKPLGLTFLILQVLVVGLLAYLEDRQIRLKGN